MKNKIIELSKINRETFIKNGFRTCFIPYDENDIEIYKTFVIWDKIGFRIVKNERKYSTHKFYFKCLKLAIENGLFEKMIERGFITDRYYVVLFTKYKNDIEIANYLLKWFCLQLLENPDGTYSVDSISYDRMNESEFKDYVNKKAIPFLIDILQITEDQLLLEASK